MNRELWQRISRLENWIRVEGKRNNTCTRQILNEVCEDCRCHRNKSVPPVIKARSADIIKSRLFWRLRAGQKPLQHRPPTCYSCPWYEVVEELTPHWTMECWTTGQNALYPKPMAIIGQCLYGIEAIDHSDGSLKVVTFGPWRFKVWVGEHPNNPKTSGWYIQRIPQEEVDGTAPETSTRSADE